MTVPGAGVTQQRGDRTMDFKRKEIWNRGRLTAIAVLVAATILFAVWALVFHHHELCVFIVENYVATLALLPALALLGLLAVIVNIDAYIRPDLKRIMRIIVAVVAPGGAGAFSAHHGAGEEIRVGLGARVHKCRNIRHGAVFARLLSYHLGQPLHRGPPV